MSIKTIITTGIALVAVIVVTGQMASAGLQNPQGQNLRWLFTINGGDAVASQSNANQANQVALSLVNVPQPVRVEALCYSVGSAGAGNVRLGLYGPITSEEEVVGSSLVVQTASTAQGSAFANQCISVATTSIPTGRYYIAYQADNTGGTFYRHPAAYNVDGFTRIWNMSYGAFPSVATTSAVSAASIPALRMRVSTQ